MTHLFHLDDFAAHLRAAEGSDRTEQKKERELRDLKQHLAAYQKHAVRDYKYETAVQRQIDEMEGRS